MREMRDSGVEWIGAVPRDWNILRGKNVMQVMDRPCREDAEVITCFRDGEVTLRSNRREDGYTFSEKELGYQGICNGDLVIHGMDGFAGAIGIADADGKGTPVLIVCTSRNDHRFLMQYLRIMATHDVFIALSTGIRQRSCDLNWKKISELPFPIPPIETQHSIMDFLDGKTAEIAALASSIKSKIDALEQYKRRVITDAVTKGLDKDAEMKDSGVEWIGEVPKGWKITTIKRICTLQTGTTPSTANIEWFDGDLQWFTPSDINDDFLLSQSSRTLSAKAIEDDVAVIVPSDTVLIVGIGATAGKIGMSTIECSFNQQITALKTDILYPKYLMYWMIANTKHIKGTAQFTTLPILNNKTVGEYVCIYPNNVADHDDGLNFFSLSFAVRIADFSPV